MSKINRVERHNSLVYENTEMDKLRKTECLCFNCNDVKHCKKAKDLYQFCIENDMAMMITRCPVLNEK